jgi:hypothetical protein
VVEDPVVVRSDIEHTKGLHTWVDWCEVELAGQEDPLKNFSLHVTTRYISAMFNTSLSLGSISSAEWVLNYAASVSTPSMSSRWD